jgi:hypothetical protein
MTDNLCVPAPAKNGKRSGPHSVVRLAVVPLSGGLENRGLFARFSTCKHTQKVGKVSGGDGTGCVWHLAQ